MKTDPAMFMSKIRLYKFLLPLALSLLALGVHPVSAQVAPIAPVNTQTADGGGFILAIEDNGTVWAWGYNSSGQLGNGTTTSSTIPVQVLSGTNPLTGIVAVTAGETTSVALDENGHVWSWGYGGTGELGDNSWSNTDTAVQVLSGSTGAALSGITAISSGNAFCAALKSDGTVWTWGLGSSGQLGISGTATHLEAVEVVSGTAPLSGIVAISSGSAHVLALKNDGTVWSWGANGSGQLGNGTMTQETSPVQVSNLGSVGAIAAGGLHSVAIRNDGMGTVWAWGDNTYGQLGNGNTTQSSTPIQSGSGTLASVVSISAGANHTVAVQQSGTAWAWGHNDVGELGNGTQTDSHTPSQITSVNALLYAAAHDERTVLQNSSGAIYSTGASLISGTFVYVLTPAQQNIVVISDTTGLWVDQKVGSDTNSGSFNAPYLTIGKAVAQSGSSGDTHNRITIRAGVYHEAVQWRTRSGSSGTPFVIRGAPNQRAIISGMQTIGGTNGTGSWALYSGSIYKATGVQSGASYLPDSFFVGMNERLMAQAPLVGSKAWIWQSYALSGSNTIITDTAHLASGTLGNLTGGIVQYYSPSNNGIWNATILSNNTSAGTVTFSGYAAPNPNGIYIVKNALSLVTQPGQWCAVPESSGTIYDVYYWPVNSQEVNSITSSNPATEFRSLNTSFEHGVVWLYGVNYINIENLEIMGNGNLYSYDTCDGIQVASCSNVNITGCVVHDNNGSYFQNGQVNGVGGDGIGYTATSSGTESNNQITLNGNGGYLATSTNIVVCYNDVGFNYTDGFDLSSGSNGTSGFERCLNCTIEYNYIHHQHNFIEHPDAIQPYDDGVQGLSVLNNLFAGEVQSEINGTGSGTWQGNVIWGAHLNDIGVEGPYGGGVGTQGQIAYNYNTTDDWISPGTWNSVSFFDNVFFSRRVTHQATTTGNYNLFAVDPYSTGSWDPYQLTNITAAGSWEAFGWTTPGGGIQAFSGTTGQEANSVISGTGVVVFKNMPSSIRGVDSINNMSLIVTTGGTTTVPLYVMSVAAGGGPNPDIADIAPGNYIEYNLDGVPRLVTGTTSNTISFTPALYGYTVGDGIGQPTLPREDFVENWGTRTNFQRDCTITGTYGGLSSSNVGSTIYIPNYIIDDLAGTGLPAVVPLPTDVLTNQRQHNWTISTWCYSGDDYNGPHAPQITSLLSVSGTVSDPFSYVTTANYAIPPSFTGYGFTSGTLPPGLTFTSGTISGTPTTSGTYKGIILSATNAIGTGTASLTITVH